MSYISSSTDVNTDSNSSLMDNNAIIPVSSPLSEKIIQSPENSESKSENKSEKRQRKRRKSKKEKKEKKGKHKRHNSSDIKKSHENREEHSKSEKSRSNIEISEEVTSEKKSEIELSQNYNDSENSREIKINYQESVESSDNEKSPSKKSKKQKKIKFKNSKKNKKKKDKTEKDKTEKEKAEKDKIEKDKTKKDKKKKDKTEKEKAEKDNTEKDKTEKDNTEKDRTEKDKTKKDKKKKDKTEKEKAEKDNTEKDKTEKDKTKKDKKKKDKTEKEKAEKDNTKKDKKKKDKKKKDKKKKANKRDEKDQSSEIYDERSSEDVRISQDKSKSPEEKHKKKGIFHFGKKKSKKDKESSKSKHNKSNQSYSELNDSLGDSILIQNNSSVLDFDQNYDGSSIEISQVDNNKSIITSQIEYILNSDDFLKKFEKLDPDALIEELDLKDIPDPPKSLELPALTESEGGLFMPPPLLNSCSLFDLSEESKPDQNKSTSLFKFTSSSTDESENSDSSKIDLQFTNISTSFCESLALSDINMLNSCNNFNSINNSNIPEDDSNDNIKVAKDNSCSFNGKIESQQTPQKRTPNVKIVISRYFKEEYCYFLNIPYSDNLGKAEILEKIKSCENGSFLDFAQENFRKHHSNHSKVSKYQTIEELASFSDKPLYKPLLKSTSDKMREISHNISAIILKYAKNPSIGGHSTDHTSGAFAFRLLQIIRSQKEITAEAFIQLIKQTRNCPTIEYSTSFWNLTMIIASYFPVPESIKNIVFNYVLETIISKKVPLKISNMARFTFIRMYDRTQLIQRAFEREFIQNAIETMPRVVFSGLTMFSCSLYEMMWCQMRKYPNLPVPLSLHLIIRTIKKNGGLLRQNLYHKEAPNNGTKELVLSWTKELPFDNSVIDEADPSDLVCLLFFWLYGLNNPIVPKEAAEIFIEKCQTEHYSEIFDHIMPLHMNTLKYVIGFLKEVIEYQKYNGTDIDGLCELFGPYIVDSLRKTVEPFNRTRMVDLSPNFVKYCIENLDCEAIYPLKPIHEQMITKQTK